MNSSLYIRTDVCSGVPGARRLPFVDTVALQRATRRRDWARVHAATSISGRMELWRGTGPIAHFQEAANRLEGKVNSAEESDGNAVFNITISAPRPHRPPIGDGSGHDER
jgi:hypothetical protein